MSTPKTDMPISTVVVDDEELARNLVASLVRRDPDLLLIDECGDGAAALDAIETKRPDLLFLDIQMPVMNGILVAEKLAGRDYVPYIIFVTAFDDYAVRAFDLDVLDYLVKPLQKGRFRAAVERAKTAIRNRETLALTDRLLQLSQLRNGSASTGKNTEHELTVRSGDSIVQLTTSDIVWIEAANQYVNLHTATRSYTVSESLSQYSKHISDPRFFRIHRSALVNGSTVTGVRKQRNGTHLLQLKNGDSLVLARSRASMVPNLLRVARLAAIHA